MARPRASAARGGKAPATRILVVDDSPDTLELLQRNLAAQGWHVLVATRADEALAVLGSAHVDLVITDIRMPGRSGDELIHDVRERHPDVEIIVVTGYATVEGAVRALQAGAWNYLAKPFTDEELFLAVRQVLARREAAFAARAEVAAPDFHGLVGRSAAMRGHLDALASAAAGRGAVWLRGEMGSGRESAARALHAHAGHAGAFLRASLDAGPALAAGVAAGMLAAAERTAAGGTLYLAGLDGAREDVRAAVADRLAHPREAGARIVLSSALAPEALARLGATAERIERAAAHVVAIPPLRDRGDDVMLLARHFLARTALDARLAVRPVGEACERALMAWSWPGNVRELRDLAVSLALSGRAGPVATGELPHAMGAEGGDPGGVSLEAAERAHVTLVLRRTGGNKSRAAEILGIDRKTLREKLRDDTEAGVDD